MSAAALRNGLLLGAALWVVIIVSCLGLTSCGHADFVQAPPARLKGDGVYIARTHRTEDMGRVCGTARAVGCASNGVTDLPNPCEWPDPYAQIACHEFAHLRGWPANHPR